MIAIRDSRRWAAPWRPVATAAASLAAALALAGLAALATLRPGLLTGLFGPPAVTLAEAYEPGPATAGPAFDHAGFDALLKRYVDEAGWVDYAGLAANPQPLEDYLAALAQAPFDALGRDDKLALLINAYNAFTLKLILEYHDLVKEDPDGIRSIPAAQRWTDERWIVGGRRWSLDQIEHQQIRPNFREPRIHFALVCAAAGCPPLRREAYVAGRIDQQLEDQARYVHQHPRWFRFDPRADVVYLTRLYDWYAGDFEQVAGSVVDYAARYAPALKEALERGRRPKVEFLDYDWSLNSREHAR